MLVLVGDCALLTCKVTHCRDGTQQELRLLVPAALCGSIIGKGGATIRQFAEDSKAAIGLSPQVGSRESCFFRGAWQRSMKHRALGRRCQQGCSAVAASSGAGVSMCAGLLTIAAGGRGSRRKREAEEEGGGVYLRREM